MKEGPVWLDSERILEYFSGVEAYRRFIRRDLTTDEPAVLAFDDLDRIVELMIAVDTVSDVSTRQVLAITMLLAEQLSPQNRARLMQHIEFPSSSAERQARFRARLQLQRRPELGRIARRVYDQLCDGWDQNSIVTRDFGTPA